MKTDYKGIDYGLGRANIDKATGIRYGVIPSGELMPEASDELYDPNIATDLGFESAEQELKDKLRSVLSDYFSDYKRGTKGDGMNEGTSRLDVAVDDAFNAIDGWADNIETSGPYLYERDGYRIQTSTDDQDLWVLQSPYFTHAQFCSPCAPGACYLLNPCDNGERAYCFGHDWFEDGKAPYPVYSVATGEIVNPA